MPDMTLKAGDTTPALTATLERDGTAVDLSNASVDVVVGARRDPPLVDAPATITDAANGAVEYQWADGDTDNPGTYAVEFVVTEGDGDEATYPNNGYLTLAIQQALQRA